MLINYTKEFNRLDTTRKWLDHNVKSTEKLLDKNSRLTRIVNSKYNYSPSVTLQRLTNKLRGGKFTGNTINNRLEIDKRKLSLLQ